LAVEGRQRTVDIGGPVSHVVDVRQSEGDIGCLNDA
jgi:hypothetical protein